MKKYNYTAVEYSRRKYTTGSAIVETGTATLPDFKTAEEVEAYALDLLKRGCCGSMPYSSKILDVKIVENGFDLYTCNSIVARYRKAVDDEH